MVTSEQSRNTPLPFISPAGLDPAAADGLRQAVEQSVEQASPESLLDWARQRGTGHAERGGSLQGAIEEAMTVASALDAAGLPEQVGQGLGPGLVTAAARGFGAAPVTSPGAEPAASTDLAGNPIDSLRGQVRELTALHRVISAANSSSKLSDKLQETVNTVVAVMQADNCSIYLYEPEWDELVMQASTDPNTPPGKLRLRQGEGITGWSALAGVPVAARDVHADPRFKEVGVISSDSAVSMLAVPIVLFTIEKLVGVITIKTYQPRDWSDNEIKFLETVAGEIAIAIENARLLEQTDARLRQKVAELTALQGVSAHIAATLNLSKVLTLIAHEAAHMVRADASTIYGINPTAGTLEQIAHYSLGAPQNTDDTGHTGPRARINIEDSAIGRAVMQGVPVALSPNVDAHLGFTDLGREYRSMFCVPLVAPRGIMGAICLYSYDERVFNEEQVHLLDAFAHETAVAIENSRLYEAVVRALEVKSAMLKEMNHRIRNNLATVAGLLSMQARRLPPNSDGLEPVRESISRIQSIAAVHDLMMGDDVLSTSFQDLAHRIADAAVSTLLSPGFDLKLTIGRSSQEMIRLNSQRATMLALVLNELLSNAILHGFEGLEKGSLDIRGWAEEGDSGGLEGKAGGLPQIVHIEVTDDGRGVPEGFDPALSAHLGLSIVRTMVTSELGGYFEIGPGPGGVGTRAHISFQHVPEPEAPEQTP